MGEVLSQLGDVEGAIRHYRLATAIRENADVYNNWGIAIYQQHVRTGGGGRKAKGKKATEAEEAILDTVLGYYRRAIELDASHSNAHQNAGKVLYHRKDYAGAVAAFGTCAELSPANGAYAYDYALALMRRGHSEDREVAAEQLHKAIASGDPGVDVVRAKHNLKVVGHGGG